jgi:hypothetical protein
VLTLVLSTLLLQTPAAPPTQAPPATQTWTGCVQAGSAPATYRLNLDAPPAAKSDPGSSPAGGTQGGPFLQLVGGDAKLDLTRHVGKRVRLTGRLLTDAEAERQAARHPNRQEAAETAAGTGGTTQRHERYVRVQSITPVGGECH